MHTIVLITGNQLRLLIYLAYIQGLFYLGMNFLNKMIAGYKWMFNSMYYMRATYIHLSWFISWEALVVIGHLLLLQNYIHSYATKKKEILTLLSGLPLGFVGGTMNFLPAYMNIYPVGNLFIPIYAMFITYSILKHHIMDIEIVLKKSIAYSIAIALLSISYLLIVVISERLLQHFVGYTSIYLTVGTAFLLGIIFVPLRNLVQNVIDRIFFKGTHTEIVRQNELLRQEITHTEKLKSVALLASGLAHEVKNPLTVVKTFSEYLPHKLHDKEFLAKFSTLVGQEVNRINELIHTLLDFSKPLTPAFKETDLHALIKEMLRFLENEFIKHNIHVETDFQSPQAILKVDSQQIRQVFLNLFLNAVEAMEEGGRLLIRTELKMSPDNLPSFLEITVADSGCGIEPKDLQNIFDPFFTKKDNGTGLGLAIVHRIVKEHGGSIRVRSAVKTGTEFVIGLVISTDTFGKKTDN